MAYRSVKVDAVHGNDGDTRNGTVPAPSTAVTHMKSRMNMLQLQSLLLIVL